MNQLKRFYIFTGKGGVGKTTLSLAFVKHLKDQNKNAKYAYIQTNSIGDAPPKHESIISETKALGIECLPLNLTQSAEVYIGKKLKSQTLGKWVIKTPFFKALINMIPGFNYLIYLGQILELLNDDPSLIIVLDSPSSGHALTMLESTHNFRDIFQAGIVFDDTKKMIDLLYKDGFMKLNIVALPAQMAINESIELEAKLQRIENINTSLIVNNTYKDISNIELASLPDFLIEKIENEKVLCEKYKEKIDYTIAHSIGSSEQSLINSIVPSMKNLV